MCDLCRAFGSEFGSLFHTDFGSGTGGSGAPTPVAANAVGVGSTGNQNIDGLLSGSAWSGTVTYSFPDSASDYVSGYGYGEPTNGFAQISATQQQSVHKIMAQIEGFTNLNIDYAGTNSADIQIAQSSEANPTAYAYYPGSYAEGGDVWFGTSYNYTNPKLGDYYYLTHLHEIGHAFGLKHGQTAGGVANVALPGDRDALEYSVMTYRSYIGGPTSGYTNEAFGYPQTFMMNDIAALQTMYGADYTMNNGGTVYTWSATTGEMFVNGVGMGRPGGEGAPASANRIFLTIWDGGGVDTYDMSNYSNAVAIDLNPGSYSINSAAQKAYLGGGQHASGTVYNAYLFQGDARSYIENAVGGSGNDTLNGNAVANRLEGGLGNDTLTGNGGSDIFVYTAGDDVITDFVAGEDTPDLIDFLALDFLASFEEAIAYASQVGSSTVFNFGAGASLTLFNVLLTLLSSDDFIIDGEVETFEVENEAPTAVLLTNQTVSENAAAAVVGNVAVDDPNGEAAFTFVVSDSRFEVTGTPDNYRLKLKSGVALDYETESSVLLTVTARDAGNLAKSQQFTINVADVAGVTINGSSKGDTIDSAKTVKSQPKPTGENDTIYGNSGKDTVRALAGDDYVNGGSSDDTLYGDDGNDTIVGGAGKDKTYGGNGNDTFVMAGGDAVSDTISGGAGTDKIQVTGTGNLSLTNFNAASASIEVWQGDGAGLVGTSKTNTINLSGLTSVSGLAFVDGGSGNDTITGTQFADNLRGGAGSDKLYGNAGNDLIRGGAGTDTVSGGQGADTFYYAETGSKNRDTISDYKFSEGDKIDLSALLDANFSPDKNVADFVRLTVSGSNLILQVDTNGITSGAKFVDVAVLSGYATSGVDQVLVQFEQQTHVLSA
jgi:Ca2+-binding RTX toxin-like protein